MFVLDKPTSLGPRRHNIQQPNELCRSPLCYLPAKMDELLKPASITRTNSNKTTESYSLRPNGGEAKSKSQKSSPPTSPDDALEILKHQPDYDSLVAVLRFLSRHETQRLGFPSIKLPTPLSAQLVQVLVSEIVPNYWAVLVEDAPSAKTSGLKLLLSCVSSITGVNAILVRLRALIQEAKSEAADKTKRPDISLNLGILLDVLCRVFEGDEWLLEAWQVATSGQDAPAKVRPRVHEILATVGGGRIPSLAAEAEEVSRTINANKTVGDVWPADSSQYTRWLGRNIVAWQLSDQAPTEPKFGSDLVAKALRLGHSGKSVHCLPARSGVDVHQSHSSNSFCQSWFSRKGPTLTGLAVS